MLKCKFQKYFQIGKCIQTTIHLNSLLGQTIKKWWCFTLILLFLFVIQSALIKYWHLTRSIKDYIKKIALMNNLYLKRISKCFGFMKLIKILTRIRILFGDQAWCIIQFLDWIIQISKLLLKIFCLFWRNISLTCSLMVMSTIKAMLILHP